MKKNHNKFNFFENAWSKKTHDHDEATENDVDIAVLKKQKRLNTAIAIFALVCAFIIWIYACSVSLTDVRYQSVPVNIKRLAAAESKGYKIEYNNNVKINYTIRGTVFAVSQLPVKGVEVYADISTVNLSEITDTKIVQLPLIIDLPTDIICTEKSQEYIEVVITKINIE